MNNLTGILHVLIPISLIIGSFLYKPIKIIFICYIVCEALSWIVFKKECIVSFTYKIYKNPKYILGANSKVNDMSVPDWLHNIGYLVRVYFYSTVSTWYYTIVLGCYYVLIRSKNNMNIVNKRFWLSYWRFLLAPVILWLFFGYKAPFDFFAKKKYKKSIYATIIVFAIYLGYILSNNQNLTYLYEPIIISYCLLGFVWLGTSL